MNKYIGTVYLITKDDYGPVIRVLNATGLRVALSLKSAIIEPAAEHENLKQLYNSCHVGDMVEYKEEKHNVPFVLLRNITADTGIVRASVLESNPISQLPSLQDAGIFQHHVVLLNSARWGDFIMTPINMFPNKDNFQQEYNLYQKRIEYLPEFIRFCNLKPGDSIEVSRYRELTIKYANPDLSYAYVVNKWSK